MLLAELSGMPLTVSSALAADMVRAIGELGALASKARADRPAASSPSGAASATLTRKPFSLPVAAERRLSRVPDASVTRLAVTPAPALLILSRMADRLVSPSAMSIVTALLPALAVKPAAGSPAPQAPSSMVSVPALSVLVAAGRVVLVTVWPTARRLTLTA